MLAVYSFVDALPPRSPVIVFPSAIVYNASGGGQHMFHVQQKKKKEKRTVRAAFSILSACSLRFMCLNIINEDKRRAVGLAKPLPSKNHRIVLAPNRLSSTLPTSNVRR
jgi:hypothetical protein